MMTNREKIISYTLLFKEKLRRLIDETGPDPDKATTWKILIMAEVAHRSFQLDININEFEKQYFIGQTTVGRMYCDYHMDWVAEFYFEITHCISKCYWPDKDNLDIEKLDVFKTFDLSKYS